MCGIFGRIIDWCCLSFHLSSTFRLTFVLKFWNFMCNRPYHLQQFLVFCCTLHTFNRNSISLSIWKYCKTLIFLVTLFSRARDFGFIHKTLFSRLFISCSIILTWEILAWTLFSRVTGLANLPENKVIANKKCFTVHVHVDCSLINAKEINFLLSCL